MQSKAKTVTAYLTELPADRKAAITRLRKEILENIPEGFREEMSYGMIGYVVPHSLYPDGYHCNPKLPLPFMNIASQKSHIAIYHMGLYARKELYDWFVSEMAKRTGSAPDMGKSCLRFKKPEQIPYDLIGTLASKMSVQDWIGIYESKYKK
jgi:uncharacterized protein YdhG (YjbR/CyaY superfamily)